MYAEPPETEKNTEDPSEYHQIVNENVKIKNACIHTNYMCPRVFLCKYKCPKMLEEQNSVNIGIKVQNQIDCTAGSSASKFSPVSYKWVKLHNKWRLCKYSVLSEENTHKYATMKESKPGLYKFVDNYMLDEKSDRKKNIC